MKNRIFAIEVSSAKGTIIFASDEKYDEDAVKELPLYLDHAEFVKKDLILEYLRDRAKLYDSDYTSAGTELQKAIDKINSL